MVEKIYVQVDFELTNENLEALVFLYQPVFSFNAMNLYLTLYKYGRHNMPLDVKQLRSILNESKDEVVMKREELEQMNLLSTYYEYHYHLVLHQPLSPKDFISHAVFGRLFSMVQGQDAFKKMVLKYHKEIQEIEGKDITKHFDGNRLSVWDDHFESEYVQVKNEKPKLAFDVDRFFNQIPDAIYPYKMRTPELRSLIEEVGSMHAVDMLTMKRLMIENSNFDEKTFNTKGFLFSIDRTLGQMRVDQDNPYDVDPISFIRYKQGYDYVVDGDRNLVKSLSSNFNFNNQVINVLLEFVLDKNEGNLGRGFVEKIASTWKRNKVETLEDALKIVAMDQPVSKAKTKVKKVAPMPEYVESTNEQVDEAEIARIRERLKNLGQQEES